MRLAKLFAIVAAVAFLALWAVPAHAQEPAITIDPPTVAAPGSATFTVSGSGYPAGETVFVLACPGAEGDVDAVTSDNATSICDVGGMAQPTADDSGSFTDVAMTADVSDAGLVVIASTQGTGASATALITVTAAAQPTPEATPTATPTATPEPEATTTALPQTGGESGLIAIIGVSIVIAGFLVVGLGRRLGQL